MSRSGSTPRRSVLTAALGVAGAAAISTTAASAAGAARPAGARRPEPGRAAVPKGHKAAKVAEYHGWSSGADWKAGTAKGVRVQSKTRPGIVIATPAGSTDYTDPHTGTKATWEYATWTSPVRELSVPATEAIVSWNARTPAGTWIQAELKGTYSDSTSTPWYVMGRWASDDGPSSIRRTSVDDQSDNKSSVWTDTLSVDDPASGLRLVSYRIRLTLHRKPGTTLTPTVWRVGAMGSDVPDRFEVPASEPGLSGGHELTVPSYSQEIHKGQYPEYDNGGEAWCSPTSSQMIIEYWGREPTAEDLAWVNPDYADPQVCHAARATFDYQYDGCGNWPFNAAYAATYRDLQGVVTRLGSLTDAEKLVGAGIPLITSQSFLKTELDGAGYGTAGHLMTVVGFTADGDVIANDPASSGNDAVRHIYKRRQWENIWLRTKRYNTDGKVVSGTGGVCYLYFPAKPTAAQSRVLKELGIR
ncbi:peptidase C39 family protein [Streptomyces sp. NPDC048636]|uniref:peptidase C39 family protein n=1 Tax=Streptomyces sp. NPDC048636 TaxID=3155762 RepID=UPI003416C7B5